MRWPGSFGDEGGGLLFAVHSPKQQVNKRCVIYMGYFSGVLIENAQGVPGAGAPGPGGLCSHQVRGAGLAHLKIKGGNTWLLHIFPNSR